MNTLATITTPRHPSQPSNVSGGEVFSTHGQKRAARPAPKSNTNTLTATNHPSATCSSKVPRSMTSFIARVSDGHQKFRFTVRQTLVLEASGSTGSSLGALEGKRRRHTHLGRAVNRAPPQPAGPSSPSAADLGGTPSVFEAAHMALHPLEPDMKDFQVNVVSWRLDVVEHLPGCVVVQVVAILANARRAVGANGAT
eukprot:CAMPEP_0117583044 /NCGR_PEP_ID=MMETSP0784-20121206/66777_1 /TAXON_ID=39447 /ORGANISM="" /LENGTH=196 /DNA_ID=CAMNT_0005383649 /DNA_START=118 /DNA_END=710 /DNA_ORIENTATION=+